MAAGLGAKRERKEEAEDGVSGRKEVTHDDPLSRRITSAVLRGCAQ